MAGLAGRAYLSLSGTRKRVARLKSAGLLTSEQGKQGTLRLTAVGRAALDMGGAQ
jgi:DNA-binding IscR family transcriptional regulator